MTHIMTHILSEIPIFKQKKVSHSYQTVDCIFNHENFFGNISIDNRVPVTNFNLNNLKQWKAIEKKAICAMQYSRPFSNSPRNIKLQKSTIDTIQISNLIESESSK